VMPLKVMNKLGLKINKPYRRICGIDSKKIKTIGLIQDLQVRFVQHPNMSLLMDVVVVDVLDAWGMLLSREWGAKLGGTLQLDLSSVTIPTARSTHLTLYKEPEKEHHVEDP